MDIRQIFQRVKKNYLLEINTIFKNTVFAKLRSTLCFVIVGVIVSQAQLPPILKLQDNQNKLGGRWAYINSPMVEDSLGQLWIATADGICIHRGKNIQCLHNNTTDSTGLPIDDVRNLFLDSKNRIWIIYKNYGIRVVNIHGQIEHIFPKDLISLLRKQVVHNVHQDILDNFWISTYEGVLIRWNPLTAAINNFPLETVKTAREDRQQVVVKAINDPLRPDYMWIGTTKGLIELNIKTGVFTTNNFYSIDLNGDTILGTNFIRCMVLEDDKTLWLGTYGGMVKFNLENYTYQDFYDGYPYLIDNTTSIILYDQNKLMIVLPEGLAFFHTKNHTLTRIVDLPFVDKTYDKNCRFFRSKTGRVYLLNSRLTGPKGLFYFTPPSTGVEEFFTKKQQRRVFQVSDYTVFQNWDNATIVAVSKNGKQNFQWKLSDEKATSLREIHRINDDSVLIAIHNDIVLFSAQHGFQSYDPFANLSNSPSASLFRDSKGGLWNGRYRGGLFFLPKDKKTIRIFHRLSSPPLLATDYIEDILEDADGYVWVMTEKGLSKYSYEVDSFYNTSVEALRQSSKNKRENLVAMTMDKQNRLWVAEDQKILIIDPRSTKVVHVLTNLTDNEQASIWDIETSPSGDIFVSSKNTLIRINPQTFSHQTYSENIGIERTVYDITFGVDSSILLAHRSGYYNIPNRLLNDYSPPLARPIITGFNIFDKNCDSLLFDDKTITLQYHQNFFSFHVEMIDFSNIKTRQIRYRLMGFDEQWQTLIDGQQLISFTNIPGGRYQLEVQAGNHLNWSQSIIQELTIIPPFWKKSWFVVSVFLLSFLVLWYIAKQRIRRIKRKANFENQLIDLKMKALQSQMNPHFLFNSLNSIRYHIVKNDRKEAANYLTKFSRLVRMILQNSNLDVVPLTDEISLLELYVSIENIRFKDQIEFIVSIDESIEKDTIGIAPMIIQPFVENSIIHGILPKKTGGIIHLEIQKKSNDLVIRLRDNGIGRKASMKLTQGHSLKKSSLGMQITSRRIALLKESSAVQEIEIMDLMDDKQQSLGTEVTFTLPILRVVSNSNFE